ncbi:MAG: M60 family metallopeptidase [Oscillospiraceae bacterium]|nr:M60 family metallopeptidase [Oscillospiraceae bacterium]
MKNKKIIVAAALALTVTSPFIAKSLSSYVVNVPNETGQVNVFVSPALEMMRDVEFTAELTGNNAHTFTLKSGENSGETSFTNLAQGEYTLKVSADGFADYVQTVNVDSQTVSVKLMTGFAEGINYQDGAHPGTLLIGDVNNDGKIDDVDRKMLANAVDIGIASGIADLNGDGNVDLVDLEYLAKGYNVTQNTQAVPETLISPAVIKPLLGDGTGIITGDINSLFSRNGGVAVSHKSGTISADTPVKLQFDINGSEKASYADGIVIGISEDNPVKNAEVDIDYIDGDGNEYTQIALIEGGGNVHHLLDKEDVLVDVDSRGNIHINLGSQIAVKKVTFVISGMVKNSSLAEISYVEFVNGMENKIPEPDADIPEGLTAAAGSKSFVLNWTSCVNVTGYEVAISRGGVTETKRVTGSSLAVSEFGGKELENGNAYTVKVQSVNGAWKSGWSDSITVVPKASSKPKKPDNVNAVGGYKSVDVSWKKAEDAEWYNVYYKLSTESTYSKIANIKGLNFTVSDLENEAEYNIYVTAENEFGESSPSLTATAKTTSVDPPAMPKFHLINTGENGEKGDHIISAWYNFGTSVVGSKYDNSGEKTAWAVVDKDPESYYLYNTWDGGGYNALGNHGLFFEFDEEYTIQSFALHEAIPLSTALYYVKVNCWDADGNITASGSVSISRKSDDKGRTYYLVKLPQKTQVKRIQFGLARYVASGNINVSEVYFYHYDPIADDIEALYADDLHLVLKSTVTQADIDALRKRINTPDEVSGELNPDREVLERELKNAEDILNAKNLGEPVYIHNTITTSDINRGFGGLNAWQPLGVTAAAGDTVTVYVGHNTKATGAATNLQLVASQYHAESGAFVKVVGTLKVGANVITVPKIWTIDKESGGALYIQYTGSNANDIYAVRVSGGVKVPILDLYGARTEAEKLEKAEAYITELEEYVANLEKLHAEHHAASGNINVNKYEYEDQNCILGASDILLDDMLLSLPAQQILAGAGSGSASERAKRVVSSMNAMEDMLELFYQHKGLNRNAANEIDRFPKMHLNIRYQRMFGKAFMYASGNHIGIEWNETKGMLGSVPVVSDDGGKYISGNYFGWGIAHEIGHCINQSVYAVAEITNNYFSQLAQAKDTNDSVRFKYDNIYSKVTSGATGQDSNVFTQLGMYWQLHLAYDPDYNYKTYDDHGKQLESLFFARVDSYARTPSLAPAPKGVALTLSGGTDQCLMRLACAAAERDLLEFFERWGKIPDSATVQYASQFPKEKRAIYYTDDDSHVYRIENPNGGYLGTNGDKKAVSSATSAAVAPNSAYQINFKLAFENIPEDEILGYEIIRLTTSGGNVIREVVGFTTSGSFTDNAAGLNNRVVSYEVVLVDKYLYRSAPLALEPIKIHDDGSLNKKWWTVTSSGITAVNSSEANAADDNDPCAPKAKDPVLLAADGDDSTEYIGTISANAEIVFEFNKLETISGFKYTAGSGAPISGYKLMARANGTWQEVAGGTLGGSKTVYFENADRKYVSTYVADAVKLVISSTPGQNISVAEFDVLGVTGDNVDFRKTDGGTAAIGILADEFKFGNGENDVIPAGSIVFTGSYKGSPAYNVVMLFDENGNIVGGVTSDGQLKAQQIILADDPADGLIQNVSDGTWIYWIEPDNALNSITKVRAELYRVNNALTNEGERLVSDTIFVDIPDDLPEITLGNGF